MTSLVDIGPIIPAGSYLIGSTKAPGAFSPCEVNIDSFTIGRLCVTAGEFYRYLLADDEFASALDIHTMVHCLDPCFLTHERSGFALRNGAADFPMIQISYWAAVAYCNWMSRRSGLEEVYDLATGDGFAQRSGFRMPTDVEWEVAATWGGSADEYLQDDQFNTSSAGADCVAARAAMLGIGGFPPGAPSPVPVGSTRATGSGLHEMVGNVREWCHDRFARGSVAPARNPEGPARGSFRVVRGGAFCDEPTATDPAARMAAYEHTRCEVYGFRLARRLC